MDAEAEISIASEKTMNLKMLRYFRHITKPMLFAFYLSLPINKFFAIPVTTSPPSSKNGHNQFNSRTSSLVLGPKNDKMI